MNRHLAAVAGGDPTERTATVPAGTGDTPRGTSDTATPAGGDARLAAAWAAAASVTDPEVPVLTIADLGVLRSVEADGDRFVVTITPTYSGCPAMRHIEEQVVAALADVGFEAEVRTTFRPAWTTDWMSEDGRRKLAAYGIAPPHAVGTVTAVGAGDAVAVAVRPPVRCPHCGSLHTVVVSEFASTACKALYRCRDCREPFDYFKEL